LAALAMPRGAIPAPVAILVASVASAERRVPEVRAAWVVTKGSAWATERPAQISASAALVGALASVGATPSGVWVANPFKLQMAPPAESEAGGR
jgi:hypothetical protein